MQEVWVIHGISEGEFFGFKSTVAKGALEDFIIKYKVRTITELKLKKVYNSPEPENTEQKVKE